MPDTATYVFCLVQSVRPPSLKGAPEGVPGTGRLRALAVVSNVWAVVADAPLDRFSAQALEQELQDIDAVSRHALAHASVVEFVFRKFQTIPLQLFALFSSDESARRNLARRRASLKKLFKALKGFEEWGVRITAARAPAAKASKAPATGRAYLAVRRQAIEDDLRPSAAVVSDMRRALTDLAGLAAKSRKESFPAPGRGQAFVAGASFLVSAKKRAAWKTRVSRVRKALGTRGHRLDVTGPWPPYQFASTTTSSRTKRAR